MFTLTITPPLARHLHGQSDEATALAALWRGLSLPLYLGGDQPEPDACSAVVTLFHDHDRELPALIVCLRGPIGIIASVRDPRLLGASVLTEVLDSYERAFG